MMSDVFQKSLKAWGIRHRLRGSLDTDKIMRAVLQYHNTPMQDCRRSPAQIVFGRQMRDFIPSLTYKYEPAKDWAVTQEHRECTIPSCDRGDGDH